MTRKPEPADGAGNRRSRQERGPGIPRSPGAPGISERQIARFREHILAWFFANGRDLPWRHTGDPYHILVSEIMLQQTQVGRVAQKYPEFLSAFPACHDLAVAPLPAVLAAWQGMGYNRRAIALSSCARTIEERHGGVVPRDPEVLATLPGIGAATAGSIAAFAYNLPVVFIETNIRRVFIHHFFTGRTGVTDDEIRPLAKRALDRKNPRQWYSALMDYGTMLKSSLPNPNRRSAHYSKQAAFAGSDREIRGRILRTLLGCPGLNEEEIATRTGNDRERVRRIIGRLVEEGFLERDCGKIRVRDR
jgi:A/G-specific adenine glycosylase